MFMVNQLIGFGVGGGEYVLQTPSSVTSTMTAISGTAALWDGNLTTAGADPGGWNGSTRIKFDFGSAKAIRRLVSWPKDITNTATWNFRYSDDDSSYTTVTTHVTPAQADAAASTIITTDIADNGSHRYWDMNYNAGSTGGNIHLWEVQMYILS